MSTTNIFEQAARQKLRFETSKGSLTVEDLWDLPLTSAKGPSLDALACTLYATTSTRPISFVEPAAKSLETATTQLKFDIVKHIVDVRMAENAAARDAAARKEKKQALLGLIAQKETEALGAKSIDELRAMVESL